MNPHSPLSIAHRQEGMIEQEHNTVYRLLFKNAQSEYHEIYTIHLFLYDFYPPHSQALQYIYIYVYI